MSDAAAAMEMRLNGPYEKATQKYSNDYECVLWAAADGHELQRRSTAIFECYQRIMRDRTEDALDRARFNQRINALKQPSHASILTGTRQGWYEFTEKTQPHPRRHPPARPGRPRSVSLREADRPGDWSR